MIPVLAGIPWLAGLIGGLFSSLFTWFAQYFTRRFAVIAAVLVIIGSLTLGLFTALDALASGLSLAAPSWMLEAAGHFLPSNTLACVTAVTTAKLLRYAYDWNIRIIQYKLF